MNSKHGDRYRVINITTMQVVQTEYWLENAVQARNVLNEHEHANGRPMVYGVQSIDTGVLIGPKHEAEKYDRFVNIGTFK